MRRIAAVSALVALAVGALLARRRSRRARRQAVPAAVPVAGLVAAEAPRFLSVPWQLAAEPPGDDAQIRIRFAGDEHMALDRVDVQETPTQVFVTVIVRWAPPTGGWFASRTETEASVTLGRPLGDRELVHGATDVDAAGRGPLYP